MSVDVTVIGLDSGTGMPAPVDYRDVAHVWQQGFFKMDESALRARLTTAKLLIGTLGETIPKMLTTLQQTSTPIGFVAFDLDYWSSTKLAFAAFDGHGATRLPRVFCYFDDIVEPPQAYLNPFVGELLAIEEYNACHAARKFARIERLDFFRDKPALWNHQMFIHHDFAHTDYTRFISNPRAGELL